MSPPDTNRIDRIIDIARGVAPLGPADREQRASTRVYYEGRIAVVQHTPSGGRLPPVTMVCQDISLGGLGAVSPRRLAPGARGAVLIEKSGGEPVIIGVRVVYCNQSGPGRFECGIEFEVEAPALSFDDFRDASGRLPAVGRVRAA